MKEILTLIIVLALFTYDLSAQVGCLNPANVTAICTDTPVSFAAGINQTAASVENPNIDYDCLGSSPNPAWYYLEINATGTMAFDITNTNGFDIDWITWGPFADVADINTSCASGGAPFDAPIDCDYSTAGTGTLDLGTVGIGEIYVVMVANYSNNATDVSMTTTVTSTATTNCNIVNDCEADQDFTAPIDACSGEAIALTAGVACLGVDGPAGSDQVVDLYVYAPGGIPAQAPGGYLIDRQAPTHRATGTATDLDQRNPDLLGLSFDGTCATTPSAVAGTFVNNTCAPITITMYSLVLDYTLDTDADLNAEYPPLCVLLEYDVVVWPAPLTVVVTDDGTTCGTPTVELRDAAGNACETLTGTACATDGDVFNYDFSTSATALALAAAPGTCVLPTLTGTVTCGGCCSAVTPVWD
jgi:hypothetical protein